MKSIVQVSICSILGVFLPFQVAAQPMTAPKARLQVPPGVHTTANLLSLPLTFEENRGQAQDDVSFLSRGPGYTLEIGPAGTVLTLRKASASGGKDGLSQVPRPRAAVCMRTLGGNPHPRVEGVDKLQAQSNYLFGNDPGRWITGIPHVGKVRVEQVYRGIDLFYYGKDGKLEYDFVVAPGADPGQIRIQFDGQDKLHVDAKGDLLITFAGTEVRQQLPVIYQETPAGRRQVAGRYRLRGNEVGMEVADYDRQQVLVIDPVLVYSTYLGGSVADVGYAIAVDNAGNAYVAGSTTSSDFPTQSALRPAFGGGTSAFVSKVNATGTALVYSTYFGGTNTGYSLPFATFQAAYGIAVDSTGSAYVTGESDSYDFPTTAGAYKTSSGGCYVSAFVSKLNPAGSGLTYSTFVCGTVNRTYGRAIAIDGTGAAYITGGTSDPNFPTTVNAYQRTIGANGDAFITKLNPTGTGLVYSTRLGNNPNAIAYGIAVDSAGNALVTGTTGFDSRSPTSIFPTQSPVLPTAICNGPVGFCNYLFVTKLNSTGTALLSSTLLGNGSNNTGTSIAIDAAGTVYIGGYTQDSGWPLKNAIQTTQSGFTGILAAIDPALQNLVFSTYWGANGTKILGVAADSTGVAIVGTGSGLPALISPVQATLAGGTDAFAARLSPAGSLLFSTYLGGSGTDIAQGVAIDAAGAIYATGSTNSTDFFVTPLARQLTLGGGATDAFVAKINVAATNCSYALDSHTITAPRAGGAATIGVTASSGCVWHATSSTSWITLPGSGSGNGVLSITAAANTLAVPRFGTLVLNDGQTVVVFQAGTTGACAIVPVTLGTDVNGSLASTDCASLSRGSNKYGDLYSFNGVAGQQIAIELTSTPIDAFLYLYSPDGTVLMVNDDILRVGCHFVGLTKYCDVAISNSRVPSIGFLALPSTGTYYIEATSYDDVETGAYRLRLLTPNSSNCPITLSSVGLDVPASGGPASVVVNAPNGCPWTLDTGATWINITSSYSSSGPGVVSFTATANTGTWRATTIAIANQTFRVFQEGSGCSFALSSSTATVAASGAAGVNTVTTGTGCSWFSCNPPNWITLANSGTGTGSGPLNYTVAPNPAVNGRAATFLVAGQSFTVNQPGSAGLSAPMLSISSTHAGNFTFGQNAAYSITVSNASGSSPSLGSVTVVETAPTGLTLGSMSGSGWTCGSNTCTRSDALIGGASYPAIAVAVNVATSAPSTVVNAAGVSGGGSPSATANDSTLITSVGTIPPSVVSLSPVTSTGASQLLTIQFSHPSGAANLGVLNVLINTALDGRQGCYVAYVQQANTLYLVNDAGDGSAPFAGSVVLNGSGSAANSQCAILGSGSSGAGSGNTFTLTLNMTFSSAFGGNRVIYAAARDTAQNNSGWQTMGVHGVPPLPLTFPAPVGMSPASGTESSATLTFTFQDATSALNLQTTWALINTALDGRAACYVAYYRPGNLLLLIPDNGDGAQATSMALTGTNTLSNSQCTVSAQGSSASTIENQLTLNLNIAFKPAFTGPKVVWMAAGTLSGVTSPWQALGAWRAP